MVSFAPVERLSSTHITPLSYKDQFSPISAIFAASSGVKEKGSSGNFSRDWRSFREPAPGIDLEIAQILTGIDLIIA